MIAAITNRSQTISMRGIWVDNHFPAVSNMENAIVTRDPKRIPMRRLEGVSACNIIKIYCIVALLGDTIVKVMHFVCFCRPNLNLFLGEKNESKRFQCMEYGEG